jgi:hypothetical protein
MILNKLYENCPLCFSAAGIRNMRENNISKIVFLTGNYAKGGIGKGEGRKDLVGWQLCTVGSGPGACYDPCPALWYQRF